MSRTPTRGPSSEPSTPSSSPSTSTTTSPSSTPASPSSTLSTTSSDEGDTSPSAVIDYPHLNDSHYPPLLLAFGWFPYIGVLYPHPDPQSHSLSSQSSVHRRGRRGLVHARRTSSSGLLGGFSGADCSSSLSPIRRLKCPKLVRGTPVQLSPSHSLYDSGPLCCVAYRAPHHDITIHNYLSGTIGGKGGRVLGCTGVVGGVCSLGAEREIVVGGSNDGHIRWWDLTGARLGDVLEPSGVLSLRGDVVQDASDLSTTSEEGEEGDDRCPVAVLTVGKWKDSQGIRDLEILAAMDFPEGNENGSGPSSRSRPSGVGIGIGVGVGMSTIPRGSIRTPGGGTRRIGGPSVSVPSAGRAVTVLDGHAMYRSFQYVGSPGMPFPNQVQLQEDVVEQEGEVETAPVTHSVDDFAVFRFVPRESLFVPERRLVGHMDVVTAMVLDPLENLIYTCGKDKTIRSWSRQSSQQTHSVNLSNRATCMVSCLELHRLVVGLEDGYAQVWDARMLQSEPYAVWKIHQGHVWSMARVGKYQIASSSLAKQISTWDYEHGPNRDRTPLRMSDSVLWLAYCGGDEGFDPNQSPEKMEDHRILSEWHCPDADSDSKKARRRRMRANRRHRRHRSSRSSLQSVGESLTSTSTTTTTTTTTLADDDEILSESRIPSMADLLPQPMKAQTSAPAPQPWRKKVRPFLPCHEHDEAQRVEFLAANAAKWSDFKLNCGEGELRVSVPLFRHFLLSSRYQVLLRQPEHEIGLDGFDLDESISVILNRLLHGQDDALKELEAVERCPVLVDCYVCFEQLGLCEEQFLILQQMTLIEDAMLRLDMLSKIVSLYPGVCPAQQALLASYAPIVDELTNDQNDDDQMVKIRTFLDQKNLAFALMKFGGEVPSTRSFLELPEYFVSFRDRYCARLEYLYRNRSADGSNPTFSTLTLVPFSRNRDGLDDGLKEQKIHIDILICRSEYFRRLFGFQEGENPGRLVVKELLPIPLEMYTSYLYIGDFLQHQRTLDQLLSLLAFSGTELNPRMEDLLVTAVKKKPVNKLTDLRKLIENHVEILNRKRIGGLLRDHWVSGMSKLGKEDLANEVQRASHIQLCGRQERLRYLVDQNRKRIEARLGGGSGSDPPLHTDLADLKSRLQQFSAKSSTAKSRTDAKIAELEQRLRIVEESQQRTAEMTTGMSKKLEALEARLEEVERGSASDGGSSLAAPAASGSVEALEERLQTAFTTVWAEFENLKAETTKIPTLQDMILRLRVDLDRLQQNQ